MAYELAKRALIARAPSGPTKAVLFYLAYRANDDGRCFVSVSRIVSDMQFNRKTINAALKALRDHSVLVDTGERKGTTRRVVVYRLNLEALPASGEQAQKRTYSTGPDSDPLPQGNRPKNGHQIGPKTDMEQAQKRATERQGEKQRERPYPPISPPPGEPTTGGPDQDLLGTPLNAGPLSGQGRKRAKANGYPEAFERLWEDRPRRAGNDPKPKAYQAWQARIREGRITAEEAHAKVLAYRRFCEATGKVGTETVMQLASFFGPKNEAYLQEWALPKPAGPSGQPNSYQGLTAKDYGKTRPGIFGDDPTPPASDGSATSGHGTENAGQPDHASTPTRNTSPTNNRWGRGTSAGILADVVESDQGDKADD